MPKSTGRKLINGYAVIMAGGRGTRFWPLSRIGRPKQLLPLGSEQSLLRDTYERILPLTGPDRILVVTNLQQVDLVREELPELAPEMIIAEPVGRNTAACSILGVKLASRLDADAPVVLLPADHFIPDGDTFRKQLEQAFALVVEKGGVATFGIPATRPETGYGYLECADANENQERTGLKFVEKPDPESAKAYVESGRHFWNSGIFVWNARDFEQSAQSHLPGVTDLLDGPAAAFKTDAFATALADAYQTCESVSIDVGIMEKLSSFHVIPADFSWSDLGSWDAWAELAPELEAGNAGLADLVAADSRGNIVHAQGKTVALLGVEDLVIVDTGDALLVADKSRSQDIKVLIETLQDRQKNGLL
jgi:mannose-1-phosphate guanylyltransferase